MVIDANIVVYLLLDTPEAKLFRPRLSGKAVLISFQTVGDLQLIACRRNWGSRRIEALDQMLKSMVVVPADETITARWASLMCEQIIRGKAMSIPDAWAAATALVHDIPILTNDGDFDNLPGLTVLRAIDI